MKKIIILFFLSSCSISEINSEKSKEILNFDKNLSFAEFNELAKKYADSNPYPNIDN